MKTGALQRSRSCQTRPDNTKTRSRQEPATINQQPSTIRGEAQVPVSDAVWSTWRRYCEAVGLSMGEGVARLIAHELEIVVGDEGDVPIGDFRMVFDDTVRPIAAEDREAERHRDDGNEHPAVGQGMGGRCLRTWLDQSPGIDDEAA